MRYFWFLPALILQSCTLASGSGPGCREAVVVQLAVNEMAIMDMHEFSVSADAFNATCRMEIPIVLAEGERVEGACESGSEVVALLAFRSGGQENCTGDGDCVVDPPDSEPQYRLVIYGRYNSVAIVAYRGGDEVGQLTITPNYTQDVEGCTIATATLALHP